MLRFVDVVRAVPGAALALMLTAPWATARAETYRLDPAASALHARLYKAGVASGFAHDHVIAAQKVEGEIVFDPAAPETFSVDVRVDTRSLEPDLPALRKRYGLEGEIDADDRATIKEHLRDEEQLYVAKYPSITFRSSTVTRSAPGKYRVVGLLTVRGKSREVSTDVTVEADAARFRGTAALRIKHTWFGFEPYSAMLGAVKNQDRIDLILELVATPKG